MDKDIRYAQKRVDESWKEQMARDKDTTDSRHAKPKPVTNEPPPTAKKFLGFLNSLGVQALFHLGEIPNPETHQKEVNLEAAREIIDLLLEIKRKTEGNLSAEEKHFFDTFLPEVQMKFAAQSV